MTETASGPARRSRAKAAKVNKGLRIERFHTTPGVPSYDEVAWERRDVVMTSWRDGSVNFDQRGVEFPDSLSNVVNIVTSKYFRSAVGTPQPQAGLRLFILSVDDSMESIFDGGSGADPTDLRAPTAW